MSSNIILTETNGVSRTIDAELITAIGSPSALELRQLGLSGTGSGPAAATKITLSAGGPFFVQQTVQEVLTAVSVSSGIGLDNVLTSAIAQYIATTGTPTVMTGLGITIVDPGDYIIFAKCSVAVSVAATAAAVVSMAVGGVATDEVTTFPVGAFITNNVNNEQYSTMLYVQATAGQVYSMLGSQGGTGNAIFNGVRITAIKIN